ncbi:hypothetical protein DWU89_19300 [Parabacteroides acidifaciens]|uniref:Uncharacterized protein n=1 Tax=Parabacteroides acidifaciens TaxID=2290935 RepID=A0A3D8H950_9BACT|nr:hypothetical protein DWU89_19300 [Parabacteroides acidifaciens]
MYAFRNGLGTSFRLLSAGQLKTVKKVNPKPINISDEIEKCLKEGVIVIFGLRESHVSWF